MELNIGAMIGLYGGLLAGLMGWWYGRKKARDNRGLDELYHHIWAKAKSYAWYATLAAIYLLFTFMILGKNMRGSSSPS